MYISDTEKPRGYRERTAFKYLLASLFCALFGAVYESFSHEVYSYYMIYAFLIPLCGGALPFLASARFRSRLPCVLSLNLYHSGIATFTVGCLFQGALEIYGTTSALVRAYFYLGSLFIALALMVFCLRLIRSYYESPER